jgi:hypothetical protein
MVDNGDDAHFNYKHDACHSPVVFAITPNEVYIGKPITIRGAGFGTDNCENNIMIGM